jgi:cytochrome c-type biogenesis protein CcmH
MSPTITFIAVGTVLVLGVLAVLLQPLWRESRSLVAGLALAIGLGAFALYRIVGTPAGVDAKNLIAMPQSLDDAISELQAQLAKDPKQPEGWRLLGQALTTEQRYAEARDAYAHAAALSPKEADVLVEAAQSRALAAEQRRFDGQAIALLQQALQLQPQHQRARWFLGIAYRQAGNDAEAAKTWEPLLAMVDTATAATLRPQINDARESAGLAPLPQATPAAAQSPGLRVRVALDPDFASRVRLRGDATVFVIARAVGGPPMPIAVERHALQDLPLDIVLDDGDSPMPTQKLSALQDVEVLARVSASGDAIPQPGDLESQPARVSLPSDKPVDLTIGAVRD